MYDHFEYLTLTQLGKMYGLSAIKIGRCLAKIGLRENGQPTRKALEEGFVRFVEMDQGFYSWHRIKTIAALAEIGIKPPADQQNNERIMVPDDLNLIPNDQPPAQGPFTLRHATSSCLEFVDVNGIVRLHGTDEELANRLLKLMNQAHEKLGWWG